MTTARITSSKRRHSIGTTVLWVALCLLLFSPAAVSQDTLRYEVDTTAVGDPQPKETSTGEAILDGVSGVLKLPFYPLKGLAYGAIWTAFDSPLSKYIFAPPKQVSFFPVVAYGSNPGLKFGLSMQVFDLPREDDLFRAKWYYSTNDYQRYGLSFETPHFFDPNWGWLARADYRKQTRESFYGVGNNTRAENEVSLTHESLEFMTELQHRFSGNLQVGAFGGYSAVNVFDGGNPERLSDLDSIQRFFDLPAADFRAIRYVTIGLSFEQDRRNHPGNTTSGTWARFDVTYNQGTGRTGDLEFWRYHLHTRAYINVFNGRVLIPYALVKHTETPTGAEPLPYYALSSLGGDEFLSGYRTDRFIDNDLALGGLQWRYPVFLHGDAFVYAEAGRVFHDVFETYSWDDWHYTVGVGFRAWGKTGEILRVKVAVSEENTRFYLELGREL